ncbi:MAG: LptF/LptG family permease [Hyphomicrobiales bacterium]|nr:LptF/LptG family permease [Hyphomicrobiales bacterium]
MPRLLSLYLGKRVLIGALVVQIALTIPVLLSALFHQLPPAALRGGLLWPALVGTLPTVTYIALPMAVGVAAALEFARMSADGMIAVLYSLRLSTWAIVRPALIVAAAATALGYLLSCWIAPETSGRMHDVLNVIRHSLNHRMLEPGVFYTFEDEQRTIYFERWATPDIAENVFIRQYDAEKKTEQTITAATAEFRRNAASVVLILSRGQIQSRPDDGRVRVTNFDEYAISLPMQGAEGLPQRAWKGVFEMPLGEFMGFRKLAATEKRIYAEWWSEAAKRFAVPLLALAHTLLGAGLVLTVASATGRRSSASSAVIAVLPAAHVGILIAAETLIRLNPLFALLVGALVLLEIGVGAWLIQRQQRGGAPARATRPQTA